MAVLRVNPNRMEVLRLRKRLILCQRGHRLLKQKQDELLKILNELVEKAKSLREEVEEKLLRAYRMFFLARAVLGEKILQDAIAFLQVELRIDSGLKQLLNLKVPEYKVDLVGDINNYGFLWTGSELDTSLSMFHELMPRLIKLYEVESQLLIISDEVEKTRRRVNALEYILIPDLEQTIKSIGMKLEELERGSRVRLMKVKEMVK